MHSLLEAELPACPECGGDMMGFPAPHKGEFLIWMCRCCGLSFVYDEEYRLVPYFMEIL